MPNFTPGGADTCGHGKRSIGHIDLRGPTVQHISDNLPSLGQRNPIPYGMNAEIEDLPCRLLAEGRCVLMQTGASVLKYRVAAISSCDVSAVVFGLVYRQH